MNIEQQLKQALQYRFAKSILMRADGAGRFPFRLEKKRLSEALNVDIDQLQLVLDKIYDDSGLSKDDGQYIDFKKEYIWDLGVPKYFDTKLI